MVEYDLPRFCPRCRGKMIQETDRYGTYASCLACGHVHEVTPEFPVELLIKGKGTDSHKGRRSGAQRHGKTKL